MPHCICYTSTAVQTENIIPIQEMLKQVAARNATEGISGILLYHEGNYLQILEGEEGAINAVFTKIKEDSRHRDVFLILDKHVKYRLFEDYKTNFTDIMTKEAYKELKRYIDQLEDIKVSKKRIYLLRTFLKSIQIQ